MKRLLFLIILFGLLVLEGVAIDLLPAILTSSETLIVPHWVLIFLIIITLFYDTSETFFSIIYGVIFGFLIDVVYTDVLGVYMFVYPFTLYIVHF
ncbi:MAG TPA: rod shape-determining protein MreD, partial [Pseudogracilibacillus sp.]|nr:rod shape-determining protein MreD [Pseudogracilibacillus sp.]